MTPSQASFADNTTFFFRDVLVTSKARPPTFLFFMELHTISSIKIFLYAMNINIFITSCIWHRIKTKQVINSQKSWTINSSNNMNLVCKAFQYDLILFQQAKLWEGFGLTDNTSLLFCLRQSDNSGFCSLGLPFFFIFGGILTSLKASRTSSRSKWSLQNFSQKFHQYSKCNNSH